MSATATAPTDYSARVENTIEAVKNYALPTHVNDKVVTVSFPMREGALRDALVERLRGHNPTDFLNALMRLDQIALAKHLALGLQSNNEQARKEDRLGTERQISASYFNQMGKLTSAAVSTALERLNKGLSKGEYDAFVGGDVVRIVHFTKLFEALEKDVGRQKAIVDSELKYATIRRYEVEGRTVSPSRLLLQPA